MKLIKYILLSALLLLGTEDIFAQAQVITGKVTELVGTASEPIIVICRYRKKRINLRWYSLILV